MAGGPPPPAGQEGCPVCGKVVFRRYLSRHRGSQDCRTRAAARQNAKQEVTSKEAEAVQAAAAASVAAAEIVPLRAEDIAEIGGELQQIPLDRHPLPGLILRVPDSPSASESPPPPPPPPLTSPTKKKRGAKRQRLE